jgi:hypothetical protein
MIPGCFVDPRTIGKKKLFMPWGSLFSSSNGNS